MKNYIKAMLSFILLLTIATTNAQTSWTYEMVKNATSNQKYILEYFASDGSVWKVGDRVTFGVPSANKSFNYVWIGDAILSPYVNAEAVWAGKNAEISKIKVFGTKRQGFALWVTCKGPMQPFNIDLEKAIQVGEVVTDGYTSDQALDELMKAKKKLELELITQEQFDELKEELSRYIK